LLWGGRVATRQRTFRGDREKDDKEQNVAGARKLITNGFAEASQKPDRSLAEAPQKPRRSFT